MPFSTPRHPANNSLSVQTLTLQNRYLLKHCMAETALGKVYWALDNQTQDTPLIVFTVQPELALNPTFERALRQVAPTFNEPLRYQPHVLDHGKEADGLVWLAMQASTGSLLSERLNDLDERGLTVEEALGIADQLAQAVGNQRPDGVSGFLEPGIIWQEQDHDILLNAPVVAALRLCQNQQATAGAQRNAFHSSYLSPEAALGDKPVSADDTFSIACILYELLQAQLPFHQYTSLEAAVKNINPATIRKLRPDAWSVLQQALKFKREERPASPPVLLSLLHKKQQKKIWLPAAALVAASVTAYASYHLLSQFMPAPEPAVTASHKLAITPLTTAPAVTTPTNPATTEVLSTPTLVNETTPSAAKDQETANQVQALNNASKPAEPLTTLEGSTSSAAMLAPLPPSNALKTEAPLLTAEEQTQITNWLKEAENAIKQEKILSNNSDEPTATYYLRKVIKLDANNEPAQKLLNQLVKDQHSKAEVLLGQGKQSEAGDILKETDELITSFNLIDSLPEQVRMEAEVNNKDSHENNKAQQYIERAKRAIDYGNLTEGDDRSESAMQYLETLLSEYPNHSEGTRLLAQVAQLQQDAAQAALRKGNPQKARTALDASQNLIGKYNLDKLVETQLTLEKRYRETEVMGVYPNPSNNTPNTARASEPRPAANINANKDKASNEAKDNKETKTLAKPENKESAPKSATAPRPTAPIASSTAIPSMPTPVVTYEPSAPTEPDTVDPKATEKEMMETTEVVEEHAADNANDTHAQNNDNQEPENTTVVIETPNHDSAASDKVVEEEIEAPTTTANNAHDNGDNSAREGSSEAIPDNAAAHVPGLIEVPMPNLTTEKATN
jgi:tetratricopeptide (TPR) repeat protein